MFTQPILNQKKNLLFYKRDITQLFRADATVFKKSDHENMKKTPSKVAHNQPIFFSITNRQKNQPKSQFLLHRNCSPRDLCVISLAESRREQVEYLVILQSANQSSLRQWVAQKFYQESLAKKPLRPSLNIQYCIRRPFCNTLGFKNPILSLFWPKKV